MIRDIIEFANDQNLEAYLVSIDQEKAFDRVNHKFLLKTLEQFGFTGTFTRWIEILYKDLTCQVKTKGFLTALIDIKRGVRQGCPLSALLYVIVAEVIANAIRQDDSIRGVNLLGITKKLSAYADDTNLFLKDLASIENAFKLLRKYEAASGTKVNLKKSKIFPLKGACRRLTYTPIPTSLKSFTWLITDEQAETDVSIVFWA